MARQPIITPDVVTDYFGDHSFSVTQASAPGLTGKQLRTAAAAGVVSRVRRGVFALEPASENEAIELRLRAEAVLRCNPKSVVSHESAAMMHGIPHLRRPGTDPELITVTMPESVHVIRADYHAVSAKLPAEDVTALDGIPITTPARTAVDLARSTRKFSFAVAVCDATVRKLALDRAGLPGGHNDTHAHLHETRDLVPELRNNLMDVAQKMRRWSGIVAAKKAISVADPAAESVLESVSRGELHYAGYPIPAVNWPIWTADGQVWADMYWKSLRLVGECDGALKYNSRAGLLREKHREDALRHEGLTVVRWIWDEVIPHPAVMLSRLAPHLT